MCPSANGKRQNSICILPYQADNMSHHHMVVTFNEFERFDLENLARVDRKQQFVKLINVFPFSITNSIPPK